MLSYLKELTKDFSELTERERLEELIDLGKTLEEFPSELKTDENRVPGCVSGVFIHVTLNDEKKLHFQGCSEALIVRGYVKILLDVLNNTTIDEFFAAEEQLRIFTETTGISQSMVASRANAFGNIFAMMKEKVKAFE